MLPLTFLYSVVNFFIKKHKCRQQRAFSVPVIVVGNLTVGGTGKSPAVMALADFFLSLGGCPGIISRGYGGKRSNHETPLLIDKESDPFLVGDEAVMLVRALPVPVVVCSNRNKAAAYLLKQFPQCSLVISDDGLQHYSLWRDVSVCLVDPVRRFGNEHCLPAGPLREPLSALKEMDFVVSMSGDGSPFVLKSSDWVNVGNEAEVQPRDAFSGCTVHAVAGIANPQRFFDTLKQLNMTVIEHVFPDHHQFKLSDFAFCDDFPIVMTEKDAVKCKTFLSGQSLWYLRRRFELTTAFQHALLKQLIR